MKNQAFVSLSVTCIFIAACGSQPAAPAAESLPTAVAVISTSAPPAAGPTSTIIPLPQDLLLVTLTAPAAPVFPGVAGLTGLKAVSAEALNCRTGPDKAWPVVTVLGPGLSVEIAGKNEDGSWWYVKNPSLPASFCWISGAYAVVTGNVDIVPKLAVSPPPLIYPTAEAAIIHVDMEVDPDSIQLPGCVGPI